MPIVTGNQPPLLQLSDVGSLNHCEDVERLTDPDARYAEFRDVKRKAIE